MSDSHTLDMIRKFSITTSIPTITAEEQQNLAALADTTQRQRCVGSESDSESMSVFTFSHDSTPRRLSRSRVVEDLYNTASDDVSIDGKILFILQRSVMNH